MPQAGTRRHRRVLAHGLRAVQRGGRHQADAGRLSRLRAGAERRGGRPHRLPVRAVGQRGGIGARRQRQGLRHRRPAQRLAQLPDVPTAKEAGRRLRDERVGGPVRAQGHAARGDRQACRRARQVPRRAHGARPAGAARRLACPDKAERSPAAFDTFVRAEIARWAPILAATAKAEKCHPSSRKSRRSRDHPGSRAADRQKVPDPMRASAGMTGARPTCANIAHGDAARRTAARAARQDGGCAGRAAARLRRQRR